MGNRASSPRYGGNSSLPHNHDREETQPYTKEVEDYKHGVTKPPEDQAKREVKNNPQERERGSKGAKIAPGGSSASRA
jgi:hypothetical protein